MAVTRIFTRDAAYQKLEVLKTNRRKRYKYNEFFVEGVRNINAAIADNWHICSFIYDPEKTLSGWAKQLLRQTETDFNIELAAPLMVDLSGKIDTSELMAVVRMREDNLEQLRLSANPVIALFDRPSNKGNLGSIIRSCDSLGIEGLIITGHAVDLYDPEVIAASVGSFFHVPVIRIADNQQISSFIADLKSRFPGFTVIGTTAKQQSPVYSADLARPLLLMLGNETDGLSRSFKEICDLLVTIPMSGNAAASSLNVASAATVMFYEVSRQRK